MVKTAIILAAGRGTRLRPYTYEIPKGLIQVGKETLIERSIRILRENGIEEIIIGGGHLSEQYELLAVKKKLTTFLNSEYATTGSFHTLFCGHSLIQNDCLLLESDLLYDSQAIQEILASDQEDIVLCSGFTHSNDEVFVEVVNGHLKNLSKKKEELENIEAELVGIWKLSYSLLQKLVVHHQMAKDAKTKDYERAMADLSGTHPIHALILPTLVWCEIDNEEHLQRAKTEILPKIR